MNGLRLATVTSIPLSTSCSRCTEPGERWDGIAGKAYCPRCQEQLAAGENEPLVERTESRCCVICDRRGTLCVRTFPLEADSPIEMDLCGEHLRALLGRRLGPHGFHQLQRQLQGLGICSSDVFLLHDAFYDSHGRALKPVQEMI